MTSQELFDFVVAHARKQNERAVRSEGRICQYRTLEGLKCFAGALIKDEFYDPRMEGLGVGLTIINDALIASGVQLVQLSLVARLQRIHDQYYVEEWPAQFTELAQNEGLVYEDTAA